MEDRYYIVNYNGEILGEGNTRKYTEMKMNLMFTKEEIENQEIEVICGMEE